MVALGALVKRELALLNKRIVIIVNVINNID